MAAVTDNGYGVAITFESGYFAEVISVELSGYDREPIETTHATSTSGWKTFIPSDLMDAGSLDVEFNFIADTTPPLDQAAGTVRLTWPIPSGDSSGAYVEATGFMTNFTQSTPIDDRMTARATIKLSGVPTWTDAA